MNTLLNEMADEIIRIGTENTSNSNWHVYFDELAAQFQISVGNLEQASEDIFSILEQREEIADIEINSDNSGKYFDIVFWLSYCKNWDGTDDWGCL